MVRSDGTQGGKSTSKTGKIAPPPPPSLSGTKHRRIACGDYWGGGGDGCGVFRQTGAHWTVYAERAGEVAHFSGSSPISIGLDRQQRHKDRADEHSYCRDQHHVRYEKQCHVHVVL